LTIASSTFPSGRDFTIFLPPGYEEETERYPVFYLQDGQNLFEPEKAYGGQHWRIGETATELITTGRIEPMIVVGIHNTGVNRINEYTPTYDRRRGGGEADKYAQLVLDEAKPIIDAAFRTLPDRENTAIGGSSLGGLVSLYFALKNSHVFGKAAVLSPSVWWDRRSILKHVRRAPDPRPRLWVDMGTCESSGAGSARRVVEDARLLKAGLLKAGWVEGRDLYYEEIEGGRHCEEAWADRFGRVLEWLFPPTGFRPSTHEWGEG
jgi:predicted alpha/beta superfamily hydrolase